MQLLLKNPFGVLSMWGSRRHVFLFSATSTTLTYGSRSALTLIDGCSGNSEPLHVCPSIKPSTRNDEMCDFWDSHSHRDTLTKYEIPSALTVLYTLRLWFQLVLHINLRPVFFNMFFFFNTCWSQTCCVSNVIKKGSAHWKSLPSVTYNIPSSSRQQSDEKVQ